MTKKILQPKGWPRPKGYSNGIAAQVGASGRLVFTAGIVGWNENEEFVAKDLVGQLHQALINIRTVLAEGGASPSDIVRMTCYVTDKRDYLANANEIGALWRDVLGRVFPCMALVEVSALVEDEAKVEIETTAIVSDGE